MEGMSRGKRMLKAGLEKQGLLKLKRLCPDSEAEFYIKAGIDKEGFEVQYISDYKGFGVFSKQEWSVGDFLLEYVGERISSEEAEYRMKKGADNKLFFYKYNGQNLCIDAEGTYGHVCQLVNDAPDNMSNSKMKLKVFGGKEHLCLFAITNIHPGQEILYSYGENENLWWRNKGTMTGTRAYISCRKICRNRPQTVELAALEDCDYEDSDPFDVGKISDKSSEEDEMSDLSSEEDRYSEVVAYQSALGWLPGLSGRAKREKRNSRESGSEREIGPPDSITNREENSTDEAKLDGSLSLRPEQPSPDSVSSRCTTPASVTEANNYLPRPSGDNMGGPEMNSQNSNVQNSQKLLSSSATLKLTDACTLSNDSTSLGPVNEQCVPDLTETMLEDEPHNSTGGQQAGLAHQEEQPITTTVETTATVTQRLTSISTEPENSNNNLSQPQSSEKNMSHGPIMNSFAGQAQHRPLPMMSEEPVAKKRKTRPKRMCVYCKNIYSGGKLKRHIKTHKDEYEEIKNIMLKPKHIQNAFFDQKRREGMYQYNMQELTKADLNHAELMGERRPKKGDSLRMCNGCKRFFSNRTFYKHRNTCKNDDAKALKMGAVKPSSIKDNRAVITDTDFQENILNRFRDNEIGNFIRESRTIQAVGFRHYVTRRNEKSKIVIIRKEVMGEMRELGRLYQSFQSIAASPVNFEEMFSRTHIKTLQEAMDKMASKEDQSEKYGLKINLNTVIQKTIKTLKGLYSESMEDTKLNELNLFETVYNFRLPEILANSRYQQIKVSMDKARKPQNLPTERELETLRSYISGQLQILTNEFDIAKYTWLRSLVVTRLTLYNARRGEEGSRILLEEWKDAVNGVWIPPEQIEKVDDDGEKYLVGRFKLAYLHGKGKMFVPILVPIDLMEAINLLIQHRKEFGIPENSVFLFANKGSGDHCSGWNCVNEVCQAASLKINATTNRHVVSTIYSSLDMKSADRRTFMSHMGHAEKINEENYQCPPGLREVRVMGRLLDDIDHGTTTQQSVKTSPANQPLIAASASLSEIQQTRVDEPKQPANTASSSATQQSVKTSPANKPLAAASASISGSYRWSKNETEEVIETFKDWVHQPKGNNLPSVSVMNTYYDSQPRRYSRKQLRTKIMNEQKKCQRLMTERIKHMTS